MYKIRKIWKLQTLFWKIDVGMKPLFPITANFHVEERRNRILHGILTVLREKDAKNRKDHEKREKQPFKSKRRNHI